jgi:hypothetical protein
MLGKKTVITIDRCRTQVGVTVSKGQGIKLQTIIQRGNNKA